MHAISLHTAPAHMHVYTPPPQKKKEQATDTSTLRFLAQLKFCLGQQSSMGYGPVAVPAASGTRSQLDRQEQAVSCLLRQGVTAQPRTEGKAELGLWMALPAHR